MINMAGWVKKGVHEGREAASCFSKSPTEALRGEKEVSKSRPCFSLVGGLPGACLRNCVFTLHDPNIVQHSFQPYPTSPTDGWHRYSLPEVQAY